MTGPNEGGNKLDFVPGLSFLPWEWRTLGTAFSSTKPRGSWLSGRCTFTVRQGFDPVEMASTGRVVDGHGDLGITLRLKTLAFSAALGNIIYKQGLDDPSQASLAEQPSLKYTIAKEYKEDQYIAFTYDAQLKKPEFSLCWSAEAQKDRATLCLHADPLFRTFKVGTAVSTPGPEWRVVVLNEDTDKLEYPVDDGARHTLYVEHQVKNRDMFHKTRVGCRLDVGRVANWLADGVDCRLYPYIPQIYWRLPLSNVLYRLLVPEEDIEQVRRGGGDGGWGEIEQVRGGRGRASGMECDLGAVDVCVCVGGGREGA